MSERKTGRRIVLNDGTIFEDGECGESENYLWCTIPNASVAVIAEKFMDPDATQTIVFEYGEMSDTYEGYTSITIIMRSGSGWKVSMTK